LITKIQFYIELRKYIEEFVILLLQLLFLIQLITDKWGRRINFILTTSFFNSMRLKLNALSKWVAAIRIKEQGIYSYTK